MDQSEPVRSDTHLGWKDSNVANVEAVRLDGSFGFVL